MMDIATVIHRFDALHLGVKLFAAGTVGNEDAIGAEVPRLDITDKHTLRNLSGYGSTADEAIFALWRAVLDMDTGSEWLRVTHPGNPVGKASRFYRWNGVAWKERDETPLDGASA